MAGTNGNGNGNGRWSPRYLLLIMLLGPGAGGLGSWWFTKDAAQVLSQIEVERAADIKELRDQIDRDMIWRDRIRDDHEQRIRSLEQRIYGHQQQRDYGR